MRIGEIQRLAVVRDSPHGLYLGDDREAVLLPNKECSKDARVGDEIEVFVYTDSEDRPVATVKRPKVLPGEFGFLRVVDIAPPGAFLDWGLDKDLLCPKQEQAGPMEKGGSYLVRVYVDPASQRVACTEKIGKFLRPGGEDLTYGQKVDLIIAEVKPDRVEAIVDGHIRGTLFADEMIERLRVGDLRTGYVKRIRPDDFKVALSLRPQGFQGALGEQDRLLSQLKQAGGSLPLSDKSPPELIYQRLGLSKGAFKKLIGKLYRDGVIVIEERQIRLVD